jgi:hypothetical protein
MKDSQPSVRPLKPEPKPRHSPPELSRRKFVLTGTTAAAAFSLVPRPVLGGSGFVAPSQKIRLAYIGCGTQGLREMPDLLAMPQVEIVAVCDPVKDGHDYVDWSADGLRASLAAVLGKPDWRRGAPGIPGGREVAKEVIETFYANQRGVQKFSGCAAYADFRELLEKEKDIDAVKIMTPDHLHATIAVAAMKKGKHVLMHKPMANRLHEARLVIQTARATKVATHFLPASDGAEISAIRSWIEDGVIGPLREIHNWSNRPVWPQYPVIPSERPPVPEGFDWDLWLGPSLQRPYHPHYTHAVFRGWYEFGGGSLADMGHYSLWPVFRLFDLDAPVAVESNPSHLCTLKGNVAVKIHNDYSFPAACSIRFTFAAKASRPPLNIFWYDGSMKPPTPNEWKGAQEELAAEGMMFVGEKGKIVADFRGENPRIVSAAQAPAPGARPAGRKDGAGRPHKAALALWVEACKGGPATYGDFLLAEPISDAFNLAAVSLRMGGRRLLFDSAAMQVTNASEANHYLRRQYRPGWELS